MPTKRLTMRRIHRLMTLHFGAGAGTRVIARELGISHSTVRVRSDNQDGCERQSGWMTLGATGGRA